MNLRSILFACLLLLTTCSGAIAQASWHTPLHIGLPVNNNYRYEDVYFTSIDTGFAVSLNGTIYKTTNGGNNWRLVFGAPGAGPWFRSIEFLGDGQTGIAGTLDSPGHVFRTTDGGNSWTDIQAAVPDTLPGTAKMMCGLAHTGNTFYGVGTWGSPIARYYKSTDKGVTWQVRYMDTAMVNRLVDVVFTSSDTGFVTGSKESSAATAVVLKTTDGGISWRKVFSDTLIGGRIWKIQALSSQLLVGSIEPYYSDTVAMIRSTDAGEHWTVLGTGYASPPGSAFNSTQGIGFATAQQGWLGGYYNGLFETLDGGQTWNTLPFGRFFNRFFVIDSTHIYAGGTTVYFFGNNTPNAVPGIMATGSRAVPHHLYDISPNPARGIVKIEFDLYSDTYVVLNIVNLDGRKSWRIKDGSMSKGHYTYEWNSADAPAGNYLVWMGTNEIPVVKKFTLLK